jgi:hypothetical protein
MDILGGFLEEGAFAPLAFLWFVLGYFTQQKSCRKNTSLISSILKIQKSAVPGCDSGYEATQSIEFVQTRIIFEVHLKVKGQLGGIMGFLFLSSQDQMQVDRSAGKNDRGLWDAMGREKIVKCSLGRCCLALHEIATHLSNVWH